MKSGLQRLLTHVLNFAGWASPNLWPMERAIEAHKIYMGDPNGFILSRFTMPASRLDEITEGHVTRLPTERQLVVSALGSGVASPDLFLDNLHGDRRMIEKSRGRHGKALTVDVYETQLPFGVSEEQVQMLSYATLAMVRGMRVFIESAGVLDMVPTIRGLASLNRWLASGEGGSDKAPVGFKLRCGGERTPTISEVASAITTCVEQDVPISLTGGLHHPFRGDYKVRPDDEVTVRMHGFLNILVAGTLALSHWGRILPGTVEAIINDPDPSNFLFDDEGLVWTPGLEPGIGRANLEEIRVARERLMIAFGTCSFEEPVEDLRRLGLL